MLYAVYTAKERNIKTFLSASVTISISRRYKVMQEKVLNWTSKGR